MRFLVLIGLAAMLAACGSSGGGMGSGGRTTNVPLTGQIAYSCANGAQLAVTYEADEARVAIIGGPSMVLPEAGDTQTYTNGRYTLQGGGPSAQWQAQGGAPVTCRGS
jgi:hypothetical protein